MKHLKFIIGILVSCVIHANAQAPNQFNYQALALDANGEILADQAVGIRIALLSGSADGEEIYAETFSVTTNGGGIFSLEIGTGTNQVGTFSSIDWGTNAYYLEVSMDASGGSNYSLLGAQQLLSVPYALYANSSGKTVKTCPEGFASVNDNYCIEINEHTPSNWFEATITCGNLNAELCSWSQWYFAAQSQGDVLVSLTDNWEWLNDGGDDKSNNAKVVGNNSITSDDSFDVVEVSNAFRCCYKK